MHRLSFPGDVEEVQFPGMPGKESIMKKGHLSIEIDKLTPCLEDEAGNQFETVAYKVEDVNILKGFNRKTKWHVNWSKLYKEYDIFALVLQESPLIIQGLVAISNDDDAKVTLLHWAVAAPHNNPLMVSRKQYYGVGGHLFAIALHESLRCGYGGVVVGHPADRKLLDHYQREIHAKLFNIGPLAEGYAYTIILEGKDARYVYEKYNFSFTDENQK